MNVVRVRPFHYQRGSTLVVALIFLVLLSIFAINAFNSSSTNVRVVGNMQSRQEAVSAAQLGIEQVISSTTFATAPAVVAATPLSVDIDQNGTVDYTVAVSPAPSCFRVHPIKNNELDWQIAADRDCITSGSATNTGINTSEAGLSSDDSLCSNTEWNIRTVATDASTGTQVALNQGVGLRVLASDANSFCP